ncbi:MAG: hypothetical protein R6X28_05495, partial [Bacteroidales bacterium]
MNTVFILFAQTKAGAALEIISLLIVAAVIAYITAWLFYRSVYKKKLQEIESEKDNLKKRIDSLNGEIASLNGEIAGLNGEIAGLNGEIKGLNIEKADLQKSIDDKDQELELYFMEDMAQYRYLIDYDRIGVAMPDQKDDLTMISGIGDAIERRLNYLGIYTFLQISRLTPQDIEVINDSIVYFSGRIDRDEWVAQATELVQDEEHRIALFKRISGRKDMIPYERIGTASREEADDLTLINGIGGWISEKLNVLDIYTFRQISNFTKDDIAIVTEAIEFFPGRIERDEWKHQASEFVRIAGDKESLLKRIRERRDRIYYDRLGHAHKYRANNLTMINGLGSWVEERLNALDIYTFRQI